MKLVIDIVSHKLISKNKVFELKDIKLEINGPSFCAIHGQSGSGKTTLLNIIAGLIKPDQGEVKIEDGSVMMHELVEYISIDNHVFPTLSVLDNLKLINAHVDSIHMITTKLGIQSLLNKKVYLLSKGEKGRVAIARALLSSKPIVLLDEPTANLDPQHTKVVIELLSAISNEKLVIITTHQIDLVKGYCDHMIHINDGQLTNEVLKNSDKRDVIHYSYEKPNHSYLIFKLMFKQLITHKVMFVLSLIFMFLVILGVFTSTSLNYVNPLKTQQASLSALKYTFYQGQDERYTDTIRPMDYSDDTDAFQAYPLQKIMGVDIEVVFENQQTKKAFGKTLEDYTLDPLYTDTLTDIYFPMIINQALVTQLETKNVRIDVGDVFPSTFTYHGYVNIHFVVVDTFIVKNEFNETSNIFPSIISKEAYLALIETSGINHLGIKESIRPVLESYNTYMIQNHPSHSTYSGYFTLMENYQIRLLKPTLITNHFHDIDSVPIEGGYYLVGDLPTSPNEIVVPSAFIYELLGPNTSDDPAIEAYRQSIIKTIPLLWDTYFDDDYFPSDIEIVGYYGYSGPLTVNMNDQVIVSDHLFDGLYQAITADGYQTLTISNRFYYPKSYIKTQYDSIQNGTLSIDTSEIDQFELAMENVQTFKNFLSLLTAIITGIAVLFFWIFMSNYMKHFQNERLLLQMIGIHKVQVFQVLIMVYTAVYIPVLLIVYASSSYFESIISQIVTKPVYYPGHLVYDNGMSYFYIVLAFILISFVSYVSSLLVGNKQIVASIKDE